MYEIIDMKFLKTRLTESKNVLTYTLHLPYDTKFLHQKIKDPTSEEGFHDMIRYMHTACSVLFESTLPAYTSTLQTENLFKGLSGGFQFFGRQTYDRSDNVIRSAPLSCLDDSRYSRVWESILTHHCLLATYDKLNDIIFQNFDINMYTLVKTFYYWGFDYAMDHQTFNVTASNNKFEITWGNKNPKACSNDKASSYSYNSYPASFLSLKKMLLDAKQYQSIGDKISFTSKKKVTIPVNMIPLLQQLRGRTDSLKHIFKLYNNSNIKMADCNNFISHVKFMYDETIKLPNDVFETCMTEIDTLFYRHKLEQTFNFDLAWCLSKNITSFNNRFHQNLEDDIAFIDIITSALNLPNTVSRALLIQMAFDCCSGDRETESDFFTTRLNKPDEILSYNKKAARNTDSHNTFDIWKKRYNNFINYMTKIIFPIYESYFFVMIYDMLSSPEKSYAENVYNLYHVLRKQIKFNAHKITPEYYRDEIINLYNQKPSPQIKLTPDDFIIADYSDTNFPLSTFSKIVLSIYNHIGEPVSSLISLDYFYKIFGRAKECFLTSYIKELIQL